MRILKKVLKITAIVFVLLISFAFAAPYLFKGKILSFAKQKLNENLNARADFHDIDISFIRSFPKASVSIKDLQIVGIGEFDHDTLISAKGIDLSLNLMSIIKGKDYTIYGINLDQPRIHALVNKEGVANWDIAKKDSTPSAASTDTSTFKMNLHHYSIKDGYVLYDDASSNMRTEIVNLDHEGSGDFTSDLFTLQTKTSAEQVSFVYGGIPYLSRANTSIDADLQVDNKTNSINFKTDQITVNNLRIATEGLFQMLSDGYNMDIKFNAPSTEFKDILSLIPSIYKNDFANIKTSGKAIFNGFVKGKYSETSMPAYNIMLDVANGFFQYPDLPKPVKNINFQLKVDNPDGVTDHTVINIPRAHLEMDNAPFDASLQLKNPVSDMYIDATAKGKLDLSSISQFVKLEQGTQLKGLLDADLQANGNVSAIEKQQYDKFHANGKLDLAQFLYVSKDYPDGVKLDKLLMQFNPKDVTVSEVTGQYMKTNFAGNGTVSNLLPYALKNQTLDGTFQLKADKLNLDDWMGVSTDTAATSGAASAPFAVPSNIRFLVNSKIDQVHYDKVDLDNVSGALQIADETVKLNNISANGLGGTMAVNGSYSTKKSKTNPDISLSYDVKGLDVQKTFLAFNTVQKLMPIGQFLSGKLSSQLSFTGKLGQDMMPDLNSLTGQGNLLLIEGFLNKFTPVDKLAQALNIKPLQSVSLKDVKNYIEFTNGRVLVKPFKLKVNDVNMEIGGMHGFDQSLDYTINLKLPRSMMGEKGNQLVNNLVSQANSKGVPMKVSDIVDLNVKMGGSFMNPTFKTDLKQAANNVADDFKQQAADFAKKKIDSTKTAVTSAAKDTFNSAKKQVITLAQDELKNQLLGKKDTSSTNNAQDTKKKLEESGKGLIENFNPFKKKKKATDSVKQ